MPKDIYLIDGAYELFRHYYALPSAAGCGWAGSRCRREAWMRVTLDEASVVQKFGVLPESIPDYAVTGSSSRSWL